MSGEGHAVGDTVGEAVGHAVGHAVGEAALIGDGVANGESVAVGVGTAGPHAPMAMATIKAVPAARSGTLLDRADAEVTPIRLSNFVNIALPPARVASSARGYHFGGCSPTWIVGRLAEAWRHRHSLPGPDWPTGWPAHGTR
jgi:hypothetical protein